MRLYQIFNSLMVVSCSEVLCTPEYFSNIQECKVFVPVKFERLVSPFL